VFAILGVAAKLEYRRIKERTARGPADVKAEGVNFGRKPKLTRRQQREAMGCGTRSSNPAPSSDESAANLTSSATG
jgi:DNA invertase Pin-like site-specific DNA recombinase